MSDDRDFDAIFDRIANRTVTEEDIQILRQLRRAPEGQNVIQIGKYSVNIGEGRDIHIGDKIYQSTDAQTIRTILLDILADKDLIDKTFQRLFPPSASSAVDWDWGMKLLQQKQLPEIRKRLTDTLGRDRILMDVSIEERKLWVNRPLLEADRTLQIDGRDCGTLDANKMLIETFGRDDIKGKFLILGAPGAGKTTALLSLAEQLVEGAISQPRTVIPVIFELSTWRNDNQSIESWLIEQLYDLHGGNRKAKLYEQWLERQVLLPLLDGLDELGLERQKKCTQKLNEFADRYPQMVVCCRVKEFEAVDIKLRNLRGAVCLQSLADSQIQHYFDSLQRPELWEAIQTTPHLQAMLEPTIEGDPGLLRVPLFVKLMADVYDPQQPISSKADLLDKYIDRQLSFDKREIDRRKELDGYEWSYKIVKLEPDWKKTSNNLSWLAQNLQDNKKVDFLIEHLQPSSIKNVRSKHYYKLIFRLIFGIIQDFSFGLKFLILNGLIRCLLSLSNINNRRSFGLISGIFYFGMFTFLVSGFPLGIMIGLFCGIIIGIINGISNNLTIIKPLENFRISMSKRVKEEIFRRSRIWLINGFIYGTVMGILPKLFNGLFSLFSGDLIGIVVYGLALGLNDVIYDLIHRQIIEMMNGLFSGTMTGVISGLVWSLIGGTFTIIDMGKQDLNVRYRPNQGVFNSLKVQISTTAFVFFFIILLSIVYSGSVQCWYCYLGLFVALFVGFMLGGGKACLQHLSLRIVLWQSGLPWNFARFLNYCVERRLLLRVGGSYRFLHRELLDHFAQTNH
jgi:Effector-associated domain 10/NACHT domain